MLCQTIKTKRVLLTIEEEDEDEDEDEEVTTEKVVKLVENLIISDEEETE